MYFNTLSLDDNRDGFATHMHGYDTHERGWGPSEFKTSECSQEINDVSNNHTTSETWSGNQRSSH